jgi:hypothetical protein
MRKKEYKIWVSKSCSEYAYLMKMTTDNMEAINGRIGITSNQRAQRSVVALCYHNLMQHSYDFVV